MGLSEVSWGQVRSDGVRWRQVMSDGSQEMSEGVMWNLIPGGIESAHPINDKNRRINKLL